MERKLDILQVGPTRYKGGVAIAIQQLVCGLARKGHSVTLIGNGGVDPRALADLGADYIEAPLYNRPTELFKTARIMASVIRAKKPDIVHSHSRSASLTSILAGRMPDWFTFHNSFLTDKVGPLDFGPIRKYLSPLGREIFVLNEEAKSYLSRELSVDQNKITLNPNGVDLERYRPPSAAERETARKRFNILEGETVGLFVGRFHEQKRPEIIVQLAERARDAGLHDVKFLMVGEGPLESDTRQLVAAAELDDVVKLVGWMDPIEAYWAADLFLMPSLYEGLGLVAAEAVACGCPVLRTNSGGAEYTVEHGVSGYICDIDESSFISLAIELMSKPEALAAMRSQTRTWAERNLHSDGYIDRAINAYTASVRNKKNKVGEK